MRNLRTTNATMSGRPGSLRVRSSHKHSTRSLVVLGAMLAGLVLAPNGIVGARALSSAGSSSVRTVDVSTSHPCRSTPGGEWLHTHGRWIVDGGDCRVRLAGVNWYGMNTTNYIPSGLNIQSYTAILRTIKGLGFNSIRLPISEQMIRENRKLYPSAKYIKKDPELRHLHPLQILDRIIRTAARDKLWIILDDHNSLAGDLKSPHIEALWTRYGGGGWIHDWVRLARRYRHDPAVVGFDLRNEPHTAYPGPWTLRRYLTQGATWGPYKSKLWKPKTDWPAAATKAGNAVLAANRHLLIFVEGIELYPDSTQPTGVEQYWWGSNLVGVKSDAVTLQVRHRLVYSPHEWGPWKGPLGNFTKTTTFQSFSTTLQRHWAFVLHPKRQPIEAPIWLGEFNTCNFKPGCAGNTKPGSQGMWFQMMIQYLQQNPEISWSYFPINGTNSLDQPSNNSILDPTWTRPELPALMQRLETIMGTS